MSRTKTSFDTWITQSDPARRKQWVKLFGTDRLPVKSRLPHWGNIKSERVMVYDVVLGALPPEARKCFIDEMCNSINAPRRDIRRELNLRNTFPIRATGCEVDN